MRSKYKAGNKVVVDFGSGAEPRDGIILETKGALSKVRVTYPSWEYNDQTMDCWLKNDFITKKKK